MPVIILETVIDASVDICFNLSRSIDLHVQSMNSFNERVIGGRFSGLINLNETVSWKARHFGINFTMTNLISELNYPDSFTDKMIRGPFKSLVHQHHFTETGTQTLMKDIFEFEAPLGILGKMAEQLFLTNYMKKLLIKRNEVIKVQAQKSPASAGL